MGQQAPYQWDYEDEAGQFAKWRRHGKDHDFSEGCYRKDADKFDFKQYQVASLRRKRRERLRNKGAEFLGKST